MAKKISSDLSFFPDFFIIGVPRCGTTSLGSYLRQHPQICFSHPKEPHYFSKLAPSIGLASMRETYLARCFAGYDPALHRAVGEGSVSYVYSTEAIETILSFNPGARFIVMMRDPLEMLPSYHMRLLFILQEDEASFERAWSLQDARARGEHLPRRCLDSEVLRYRDVARYAVLLRRLFSLVDPQRCLAVLFDDLKRDPRGVYERCLRFLGVPSDGRSVFAIREPSRKYRYASVQQLVYPPLGTAPSLAVEIERRALRRGTQNGRPGARKRLTARLRKRLKNWNTVHAQPEALSPAMQDTLCRAYARDVGDLADLLQRDLSHWLQGRKSNLANPG
jgi:hypothetical protein